MEGGRDEDRRMLANVRQKEESKWVLKAGRCWEQDEMAVRAKNRWHEMG